MNKNYPLLSVTVLYLILTGCSAGGESIISFGPQNRNELTVAFEDEVPGLFASEGEYYGYHYRLLEEYAQAAGKELRLLIGISRSEQRRLFSSGHIDMVVGTGSNNERFATPVDLYKTGFVIMADRRAHSAVGAGEIIGKLRGKDLVLTPAFRNSPYFDILMDSLSGSVMSFCADPKATAQDITTGRTEFFICEATEASICKVVNPRLSEIYSFSYRLPVRVMINPYARNLEEEFSAWLDEYRVTNNHDYMAYCYFRSGMVEGLVAPDGKGRRLSPYDEIIKYVAEREGMDWRLLTAIAYTESRFNADIVSPRGARGLMQIMPAVARQYQMDESEVMNPESNVTVAVKLLRNIERSLKIAPGTPADERMKLILACYNGGVGHVLDARRLAAKYGADPDRWSDVADFLGRKALPEYHNDEVVSCGNFHGSGQTIAFVNSVMGKYRSYCSTVLN